MRVLVIGLDHALFIKADTGNDTELWNSGGRYLWSYLNISPVSVQIVFEVARFGRAEDAANRFDKKLNRPKH